MSYLYDTIKYRGVAVEIYQDEFNTSPRVDMDEAGSLLIHDRHWHHNIGPIDRAGVDLDEWLREQTYDLAPEELQKKWDFFCEYGEAYDQEVWTESAIEAAFEEVKAEAESKLRDNLLWAPCCIHTNSSYARVDLGSWYDSPDSPYNDGIYYITLANAIKEWGKEGTTCWEDIVREEEGQPISLFAAATRCLDAEFEIFSQWVKGEAYYYQIQRKDADDEDRGDSIDSCGGFYGDDFEKNGLLEHARNAIDCAIEEKKKELQEARRQRALQPKQLRIKLTAA